MNRCANRKIAGTKQLLGHVEIVDTLAAGNAEYLQTW